MIPIRDTIQSKNYPVVNNTLIVVNVLFFIIQLAQGRGFNQFIVKYGLVPARYSIPEIADMFSFGDQALSLLTFMFLHGGFWHLLGNMWSLYIFGDNIEDRLGHTRYLIFYLLCGLASGLFHLSLNFYSRIPTIGASGAIAGVMGAYLISYPHSKILTLIPLFFIPYFIEIPAVFFLGIWFVLQFMNAAASSGQAGGVAWWAHIGGFIAGIVFLKLLLKLPETGLGNRLKSSTSKHGSHRLQIIRPRGEPDSPDLSGEIVVSPFEATTGTRKTVSIPWGFQQRLFRITVPSGIKEGALLRLEGMGRTVQGKGRGDLFLRVLIRSGG